MDPERADYADPDERQRGLPSLAWLALLAFVIVRCGGTVAAWWIADLIGLRD